MIRQKQRELPPDAVWMVPDGNGGERAATPHECMRRISELMQGNQRGGMALFDVQLRLACVEREQPGFAMECYQKHCQTIMDEVYGPQAPCSTVV